VTTAGQSPGGPSADGGVAGGAADGAAGRGVGRAVAGEVAGGAAGGETDGDPEAVARAICLRLLSAAPRTRAQLAQAMARRNVPEGVTERILERFTEVGLIDDAAFAAAWVESRHVGRGMGRRALAHELRARGVEDEVVDGAVCGLTAEQERATAEALVARKLAATRGLDPQVRVRRLAGMLARKGYPAGVAARVIREALEADGLGTEGLDDVLPDDHDTSVASSRP
jgi:regulatory protein